MHQTLEAGRVHLSVDGMILTIRDGRLTLLLARRTAPPFEGSWALPGRLVALEESAETAVHCLLDSMLPGTAAYFEQLYTFTALSRDPRGRVASVAYLILLPWERLEKSLQAPGVALRCFTVVHHPDGLLLQGESGELLSPGDLAFDHGQIVRTGVTRLQGKIDYTDIGFHLLADPEAFSLSELQCIFEAVLNTTLDASNFRRGIMSRYETTGRIVQTDQARKLSRGRPAALYRLTDR